jgi:hypothetical protein
VVRVKYAGADIDFWFLVVQIFEGEVAFNSAVISILNKIYVCYVGFEMRVQGFISANSTTTDSLVKKYVEDVKETLQFPYVGRPDRP